MAKALVIKGANFALNKVTTVELDDVIPCTGLTISKSTINFTALNATDQLTVTKTPADSTENVTWMSSNTDVVTVSNGLVTCVGVGSATVSAMCGSQIATCSITASETISADDLALLLHRENSGTNLANGKDYCGAYTTGSGNYLRYAMLLSPTATESGYKALSGTDTLYDGKYPIMLPHGTTSIKVTCPSEKTMSTCLFTFIDSTKQPTYNVANKGARAVTDKFNVTASNNIATVAVPSDVDGLDSFYMTVCFSASIEELPSGVTIEFN